MVQRDAKMKELKIEKIAGVGEFENGGEVKGDGKSFLVRGKAFVIKRKNTIEVRTDERLARLLREKYETVMESRYFGKGGIEIVMSGQLLPEEIEDLVRLSYNLTREQAE